MNRLVYILEPVGTALRCVIRTTKLMKWEAFSPNAIVDAREVLRAQYASYVQTEDRALVMGLIQLTKREGEAPVLEDDYGHEVLRQLVGSGRCFMAGGNRIRLVWGEAVVGALAWEARPDEKWQPVVRCAAGVEAFALNPPVYVEPAANRAGPVELPVPARLGREWLAGRVMDRAEAAAFCLRLARRFPEARFPAPAGVRWEEDASERPRAWLTLQARAVGSARGRVEPWVDLQEELRLRLRFIYGGAVVAWDAEERVVSFERDGGIVRVTRDAAWEKRVVEQIGAWGFAAEPGEAEVGFFNFDSSVFALAAGRSWHALLAEVLPGLEAEAWQVDTAKGLRVLAARDGEVVVESRAAARAGFDVRVEVTAGGARVPLLPALKKVLRARMKRGLAEMLTWLRGGAFALQHTVEHEARTERWWIAVPGAALTAVTDQVFEVFDREATAADGSVRVDRWRLGELVAGGLTAPPAGGGEREIRDLGERLRRGVVVEPRPAPAGLRAELRPYQRAGLGWLHALADVSTGGILADDMGLGKTVQTIAHLLELKAAGGLRNGALIVAPTSVLPGWLDELGRHAPELAVARHDGPDRGERWATLGGDVVVTTYALLWRDLEQLRTRAWDLVVLDEAQYVKNVGSRTSEAARALPAGRKLALSGTPIENRLEDLWALFECVMPGFLGEEAAFRQRVARPLADDGESDLARELRERLRRRLAPFVLRRRKEDVLPDLPAKTEVVHAVAMTPRQAELYRTVRREAREAIRQELREKGVGAVQLPVLVRLLRLRQICCDPRLADEGRREGLGAEDSAKLSALLELLTRLRTAGGRTLVFSQFTSMLDLIAPALTAAGLDHLMLTGETQDRAAVVKRFQEGDAGVFLISLRAGGAGLNLTGADNVIHYDPWWNPAVERQATDRAHRIGQQKPVFVYKLIADDSIESKIQQLQRDKLALARGLLSEGDIDRVELDESTIEFLLEG